MTTPNPPDWARWLLKLALSRAERATVLAEMDELYAVRVRRSGIRRAIWWYLRQVIGFPVVALRHGAADTVHHTGNSMRRMGATGWGSDIRYSTRSLYRAPTFSLTVLVTLGLGLAGVTTIFTLAYGILLKPLPYHEADRLVAIFTTDLGERDRSPSAPANVEDWRRDNVTVEDLTAAHPWSATALVDEPRRLQGLKATWALFDLLQATPMLGRTWHAEDSLGADDRVMVLGHSLWQREFGADSSIVGQTFRLDGEPYQVIGVMPDDFGFPPFWASGAEFWVPLDFGPNPSRGAQYLRVFGRLRSGVDVARVQSDFTLMNERLTQAFPDNLAGLGVLVESLHEPVVSQARPVLIGLLGATLLLLAVAVANVGNLMVGRALARDRDRALRSALGAPFGRLVWHELIQSVTLSLAAGVLGVGLAAVAVRLISTMSLLDLPRAGEIAVDGTVVATVLLASVIVGVFFGSFSAMRRSSGSTLLRAGVGHVGRGTARIRDVLVVAEVALATVLLIGAGLTLRSLVSQMNIDTGLDHLGVLTATIDMGGTPLFPAGGVVVFSDLDTDDDVERQLRFFRELVERTAALPGVSAAGVTSHLPLAGDVWSTSVSRADRPVPAAENRLSAVTRNMSPDYPTTVGMSFVAGTPFTDYGFGTPNVVIINQMLAGILWPGEDAVGNRMRLGSDMDDPVATVVGVVADVKQASLSEGVQPEFYRPYGQNHFPWNREVSLVVRTAGPPTALAGQVLTIIREAEPLAPVNQIHSMTAIVAEQLFAAKAATWLVGTLAAFAAAVSGLGLFGVMTYLVGLRRREFGIRMALGASPHRVVQSVLSRGGGLVLAGLSIGMMAALAAAGSINRLLYQVAAYDVASFVAALATLGGIGLLAVWVPAHRAGRINPTVLMRTE